MNEIAIIDKVIFVACGVIVLIGKEIIDRRKNGKSTKTPYEGFHCKDHSLLVNDVIEVKGTVSDIKTDCAETKTDVKWIKRELDKRNN